MINLQALEMSALIEMLAKHTADYTKMLSEGPKEEYEKCKLAIRALQSEIESRKQNGNNTSLSNSDFVFAQ